MTYLASVLLTVANIAKGIMMNNSTSGILFFLTGIVACAAMRQLFLFEAEDFTFSRKTVMHRSRASRNRSVLYYQGDRLHMEFCLRKMTTVQLLGIQYSNDGEADRMTVLMDGAVVGRWKSEAAKNMGSGWNYFRSSGVVGKAEILTPGRHSIVVNVTEADRWGVELDVVILQTDDVRLDERSLRCSLYCFDDIQYNDVVTRDDLPSARFVQQSWLTSCSEEENVKISMYHQSASHFRLSAFLPKYKSYANIREPDFKNCDLASPLWEFDNIVVRPRRKDIESTRVLVSFRGSTTKTIMLFTFSVAGLSLTRGIDESKIGSLLTLKIRKINSPTVVSLEYLGKERTWSLPVAREFTSSDMFSSWPIPDMTWTDKDENLVRLVISSKSPHETEIETIRLEKRQTNDSAFKIYSDDDIIIEGVNVDFWWLAPQSMGITVLNHNSTFPNVECLRVYSRIPWTGGYSQVLVMYQDGHTRLLPVTPHGLDWIPFGTTVVIGQTDPYEARPRAPIRHIEIDSLNLILRITYHNNATLIMHLEPLHLETKLTIRDSEFEMDRQKYPILTFRSMWVADGNADVDHMSVNGDDSRHIMADWEECHGVSAVFFRKCISKHNNLSPDIKVEILGDRDVRYMKQILETSSVGTVTKT